MQGMPEMPYGMMQGEGQMPQPQYMETVNEQNNNKQYFENEEQAEDMNEQQYEEDEYEDEQ